MTAPERFAESQIPLVSRAPSIHDPLRPSAVQLRYAAKSLFDHLVGAKQDRLWHRKAERLGGLAVHDHLVFRRKLYREIARLRAAQDAIDIRGGATNDVYRVGSVGEQTAVSDKLIEHVLPNTWEEFAIHNGLGCDPKAYMDHHFTAEELAGKPVPDQHWHEHATCFKVGDRGLVVLSSCGHAGIINTLRRAQEVTGVEKIYALVGGFHLAPAPADYLAMVMAELKKFDLAHVMPMHCSGQNFIDLAKQQIPEKLVLCGTGSSYTFTA